jgi:hypothetical protein
MVQRKVMVVVVALMLLASVSFANEARIAELKAEQQKIANEIQSGQQYIQNKQIELLKNQGAIDELSRPEFAVKAEAPKE